MGWTRDLKHRFLVSLLHSPCPFSSIALNCIALSRVDKAMGIHTYWDGNIRDINQGLNEQKNELTNEWID